MEDFQLRLERLLDRYLEDACPCRFPRFRAVVARVTRGAGGGSFTSEDQRGLIRAFDRRAPIVDQRPMDGFNVVTTGLWIGRCGRCGSTLRRSFEEGSPGGTMDLLRVFLASGMVDVGCEVNNGPVYRCRPLEALGAGMAGLGKAAQVFPLISENEWFDWMHERRVAQG
jgi:hypothetical protein